MSNVHDFRSSLARSHSYSDAPWWIEVYRSAFPSLIGCHDVRQDGWHQRAGIDRVLVLGSSKTVTVDEKVRSESWPDVLLEYWSDKGNKVRGWVAKDLACDYIAYAFVPSRVCLLLPFQTLRLAWVQNCQEWARKYQIVQARNPGYITESVAIPTGVLLDALKGAMSVSWAEAA